MAIKVFLSYSREDKGKVEKLYDNLNSFGFSPWMDEKDLLPGQNWELEIKRAMKSCDFLILCLSRVSVAKRGYVQRETKYALDLVKEFPEDSIYLIPTRLDDCQIPQSLTKRQWVDLFERDGLKKLIEALKYEASKRNQLLSSSSKIAQPESLAIRIDSQVQSRIVQLQNAAERLRPYLLSVDQGRHELNSEIVSLSKLADSWKGKISDKEYIARLESVQNFVEWWIASSNRLFSITAFLPYLEPSVGIGPGNLVEALAAYKTTCDEVRTNTNWLTEKAQSIQSATYLPFATRSSLASKLMNIRTKINQTYAVVSQIDDL